MILLGRGSFWNRRFSTRFKDAVVWPVFSISSSISPRYQLREKPAAFPATAKIMIGHRLGHLNFTLYRKQRGPPNHGVNVNDARFRAPFHRTRKLNDNDIANTDAARNTCGHQSRTFIFFFSSRLGLSRHSFSFSLRLGLTSSPPPPPPIFSPYFRLCSSFGLFPGTFFVL